MLKLRSLLERFSSVYSMFLLFAVLALATHSLIVLCFHADGSVGLKVPDLELSSAVKEIGTSSLLSFCGQTNTCFDVPISVGHDSSSSFHYFLQSKTIEALFFVVSAIFLSARSFGFPESSFAPFLDFVGQFSTYPRKVLTSTVLII